MMVRFVANLNYKQKFDDFHKSLATKIFVEETCQSQKAALW